LGAISVNAKTTWSRDYKQLVETHHIRTKQGRDGQLTIKRYLTDEGKTLVVAFTLKLIAEPDEISARQIWRKGKRKVSRGVSKVSRHTSLCREVFRAAGGRPPIGLFNHDD